ncbi:hypothetical protein KY314_00225, partial [Candidatus Woesearchaeota archaeon]|nr:hypothetical protein [Candidatus Woesearchaeota archaeon]
MKLTKEQARTIQLCSNNFYKFTTEIFSQSTRFDDFKGGDYVKERCNRLAKEKRTIDIAARSHFKSTSLYSYILWKMMYGCLNQDLDIRYFSFNKNLSSFHIREIKSYRTSNPFFEDFIDYKPLAESIITGSWNRKHKITVKPHGLMSFSRGIKTDILCIDDPFKDPENPLKPTAIKRINYIFKSVLLKSVRKGGEIHVVGTPLSYADFTLDPKIHKTFSFKKFPGIVEENGKEVPLWPEFYTVKELKDEIPIMGEKIWQREIMCEPYYSEESYFKKSFLRKNVVNKDLSNIPASQGIHTENRVVAGLDIGKKKHPAGISVFEIVDNKAIMRHWRMVKGWPYFTGKPWNPLRPSLLEYCK